MPNLAPSRMIAVLLASPLVPPGGLDMPERVGINPHIGPGRRDHDRLNAPQGRDIAYRRPVGTPVIEAAAGFMARDPGLVVEGVIQPGEFGRLEGIERL